MAIPTEARIIRLLKTLRELGFIETASDVASIKWLFQMLQNNPSISLPKLPLPPKPPVRR